MTAQKAFLWLDDSQLEINQHLVQLSQRNSGSFNLPGLLEVADWLENWIDLEVPCQRIPLADRRSVADDGQVEAHPSAPILRWDIRPESKRRILLAIHYDTVFGLDHDFQLCKQLSHDRLQGPGVADAKGGICVIKKAVQALMKFGDLKEIGVTVVLNPDEEIGSPSSVGYFQKIASDFEFALLFEPALPSGQLVSERKGSGNFELVVRGRSAHAGRHFHDGRNALAQLCNIFQRLDQQNSPDNETTINIGAIQGGGPVNVVPDLAVGRFNVRVPDQAALDDFTAFLNQTVQQFQGNGFQVELHGGMTSPPKLLSEQARILMNAIEESHRRIGSPISGWRHTGGVCDGNKLAAAGLVNIDTLGPIGDGLHSSGEWVQLSSIVTKAKVVYDLIQRYADGEFRIGL